MQRQRHRRLRRLHCGRDRQSDSGTVSSDHAQNDILSRFENVTGSAHNHTLTGNTGNNPLVSGLHEDHTSPRSLRRIRTRFLVTTMILPCCIASASPSINWRIAATFSATGMALKRMMHV